MEKENKILTDQDITTALKTNSKEAKSAISDEDKFERLVQRLEIKLKLVPLVGEYISDIVCMVALVRSYIKKEYTDIPIGIIIGIVSALIYFVTPIDLIPDFIPFAGHIDDAMVFVWVIKSIHSDIEEYKAWRIKNGKQIKEAI